VLRLPEVSLIVFDRRLRSWYRPVIIRIRVFFVFGDWGTEPNVSGLLRHRVEMLRMPRIRLSPRIRWMMEVIGMIAIHLPDGGLLHESYIFSAMVPP
jgi:hypothetical protein